MVTAGLLPLLPLHVAEPPPPRSAPHLWPVACHQVEVNPASRRLMALGHSGAEVWAFAIKVRPQLHKQRHPIASGQSPSGLSPHAVQQLTRHAAALHLFVGAAAPRGPAAAARPAPHVPSHRSTSAAGTAALGLGCWAVQVLMTFVGVFLSKAKISSVIYVALSILLAYQYIRWVGGWVGGWVRLQLQRQGHDGAPTPSATPPVCCAPQLSFRIRRQRDRPLHCLSVPPAAIALHAHIVLYSPRACVDAPPLACSVFRPRRDSQ